MLGLEELGRSNFCVVWPNRKHAAGKRRSL
jgi:hypothetical protein